VSHLDVQHAVQGARLLAHGVREAAAGGAGAGGLAEAVAQEQQVLVVRLRIAK
jgi:hypothetical protein